MKAGYKVFLGINIGNLLLALLSVKLPSLADEALGLVALIGLLHAIFIAKSKPQPVNVPAFYKEREKTPYEKEEDWRWYQEQTKNNKW